MERNPTTEKLIGNLQWDGKYWGPEGALKIGQDYYENLSGDCRAVRDLFFIQMSLASLFYSASGSAKGRLFKILELKCWKFWETPLWAWQSYKLLQKAWNQIYFVSQASLTGKQVNPSAADFDVIQSVARKWYRVRLLQLAPKNELELILKIIQNAISNGLKRADFSADQVIKAST